MGGGDGPQNVNESTKDMLAALSQYAPGAIKAITDTTPYTAAKMLEVEKANAPGYAQLQTDLYRDYAPELNRLGREVDRQNQLQSSANELELASGTGSKLVDTADMLQRKLDPEFYKQRGVISDAMDKFLSGYDPNKLTETEEEGIARGLGRMGPVTPSAMNTIRNAQTFGEAGTNRWKNFGNALNMASSALPNLKTGFTGFEVATRRALTPNSGDARFMGTQNPGTGGVLANNFGFANNSLNEIGATERANIAKRKDIFDQILSATQSFSNVAQGVGSFV